jgi:hypothetical protein
MNKTCAWCKHCVWSDENFYHVCMKDPDHKEINLTDECNRWKRTDRFHSNMED